MEILVTEKKLAENSQKNDSIATYPGAQEHSDCKMILLHKTMQVSKIT